MFNLYVAYYLIMNILTFFIYRKDKMKAIRRQWRIPESVLLTLAVLGGCFGAFIAMRVYRHKIHYARFSMGVPALILIHGCLGLYLFMNGYLPLPMWLMGIL